MLKIAYSGTLIYNPTTWASIFLPATGYRDRTGSLNEIGLSGYYWTSSYKVAKSYAVGFMSKNTLYPTIGYEFDRSIGGSVRCVKGLRKSLCDPMQIFVDDWEAKFRLYFI